MSRRFIATLAATVALAAAATTLGSAPAIGAEQPPSSSAPKNAAKVYRWGKAVWKDEFKQPLSSQWKVSKPGLVRNQHGMLTQDSASDQGDLVVTASGAARQYGRWEARLRGRTYGTGGTPFRLVWGLTAVDGPACGARDLGIAEYTLGSSTVSAHLRNTPDVDFTSSRTLPLRNNEFHSYAVEVTPDRISWFVDTRVVMTERRPEVRTGASYVPTFKLLATPGATMRRSRMQMDWARYYTLERRNAHSIEAPAATLTTSDVTC